MEDRLHVYKIRAKQWPNNRQYLIQLGTHWLPKYDKDSGWRSIDVRPQGGGGGGRSPYYFLRQRGIAGKNGVSLTLLPGKRQFFLTYTIVHSSNPVFSKQISRWINITKIHFLQFYMKICHSIKNIQKFENILEKDSFCLWIINALL